VAVTSEIIRRHVVCSPSQADAVALWIGLSYIIDALSIAPMLLVTAATMRSGKTTLLTLLTALVPRPLAASNMTGAVLARAIAAYNPTLLCDEADTWLTDEASDLRGILNAGHTRPTAYILRCAAETHEPTLIPCFGARALSMIRRPPATITDRSIVIELRRKRGDEAVQRYRIDRLHEEHLALRRQWKRWADDHMDAIRDADPAVPDALHDRAADNWRPLLAIADLLGADWPTRARAAALDLIGEATAPEEAVGVDLLRDIHVVYSERDTDILSSSDLAAALVAMVDRPWAEWSHGRPMTAAKMARMLAPFGAVPTVQRIGTRTPRAYRRAAFTDAWTRYTPDLDGQHRNTATYPINTEANRAKAEVQQIGRVADSQTSIGPMNTGLSCGVALPAAENTEERVCDADLDI
jgi:putative DNA primase/helicase